MQNVKPQASTGHSKHPLAVTQLSRPRHAEYFEVKLALIPEFTRLSSGRTLDWES